MGCVRLGEKIMKKDSICQVDVINQQNVTTATNYLEKEKVQKSLRILSKFTDNKQINIIFYLLAVEELCVCDIACLLNLSMASASHHLRKLANQNILDTRREGKIIYYFRELYTSLHHHQHIVFMRISKKTISVLEVAFSILIVVPF